VLVVSPAASAELATAPKSVSVRFTEPVTADAKRVQLLDAKGKVVAVTYRADENGALQVLTPTKALAAGLYALRWSVVSGDGHVVTGASTFAVKTKAPTGKGTAFTVALGSKKARAVVTASRAGAMSVKAPSSAFVRAEFKHRRLGATLTVTLVGGQARVVLPFAGAWTVTMVEKSGTFTELRWAGTFTLR
jgi:methionine-rich copper-binding protein CopC